MSIRVDFWYSTVSGGVIVQTMETITAGTRHDVLADQIPNLTLQVEQNLAEFTCGDISLVCRNDDNWWDATAFTNAHTDPTLIGPLTSRVDIYQNGILVFQGDVDFKSVTFDRKMKTVGFTILGPLNRLAQFSAELCRRDTPSFADFGATGVGGTIVGSPMFYDSGTHAVWGDWLTNCILIDSAGTLWQITGPAGLVTPWSQFYVGNGLVPPPRWGSTPAHTYPENGAWRIVPIAAVSRYAWSRNTQASNVTSGATFIRDIAVAWPNGMIWVGTPPAAAYIFDSKGVPFGPITSMTQHNNGAGNVYDQVNFPARSGGIVPDMSAGSPFYDATFWVIRRTPFRNCLDSFVPWSTLGIVGQTATEQGDQLRLTTPNAPVEHTFGAGQNIFQGTYVAHSQDVMVQIVGPNASNPALSQFQAWLTTVIDADIDAGNGVTLATPYFRDYTVAQLVNALLDLCTQGGVALPRVVNVPTTPFDFSSMLIPYGDFTGKSVADALTELASICGSVLYCTFSGTPSSPVVTYNFQARDVGTGSVMNVSAYVMERSGESISDEWYYPAIEVKGANGTSARKGSRRPGANQLSVSTDFVSSFGWLHAILERLWSFFGVTRAAIQNVVLKSEALALGTFDPMSRLSLSGADEWWVMSLSRPLRQPFDAFTVKVVSAAYNAYTAPDDAYLDLTSEPEAPIVTSITGQGNGRTIGTFHDVYFSWNQPEEPLIGFNRTVWAATGVRPAQPSIFIGIPALTHSTFVDAIGAIQLPQVDGMGATASGWYVDYQAVLIDGRMSKPCPAQLLY